MSQPTKGKKSAKASRTHGDKNAGGASGDKKGTEAAEKKPSSAGITESPKTHTSGTPSTSKTKPPSTAATKTPAMKPSETKASSSHQQTSGLESHKRKRNKKQSKAKMEPEKAAQLSKPPDSQTKHPSEDKQRDPGGTQNPSKPSVVAEPKQPSTEKATAGQVDKSTKETSVEEPKAKSDDKSLSSKAAVAAATTAGAVAAGGLTSATVESKEKKMAVTTPAAASTESKPSEKSALDELIDTLGGPEENEPPSPAYTGPHVLDPMSSLYIEELGKRESTIPPEYRKLLEGDGKVVPPPVTEGEAQPTMTDDDLADALSSDFTCSAASSAGEKKDTPKEPAGDNDLVQALSTNLVSSSAPPKEKKPKLEEEEISGSALDALVDALGLPEPEPEVDLSSIVEVEEPKAKEKKEKKAGERDDTIPPEYRLQPALDKDGKPLLPKPEEKPKPISESELADEFSKDFVCPAPPAEKSEPSKPIDVSKKPAAAEPPKVPKEKVDSSAAGSPVQSLAVSAVSTPSSAEPKKPPKEEVIPTTSVSSVQSSAPLATSPPSSAEPKKPPKEEVIPTTSVSSVQSSAPLATAPNAHIPDEALEALSGSLGGKEPDLEEKKPAVDKLKEKTKQKEYEKLGEDEETIPPDYRLIEAKGKDGKPLLPKPEDKSQPMSESELFDALSEGFSCSSAPTSKALPQKLTAASKSSTEEVVSSASASAVHSSAPPATVGPGGKELDDAADLLADSLGQREPDPDENKPVVDKVKEKAKSEHKDKLGERDDTIPPEYRHLLDSDEKGKPIKPTGKDGKKPKEQKKPADDSAAIDALSGDFDDCGKAPVSQQPPTKNEKAQDTATAKSVTKDEKKPKASKKAKEQSSGAKSEKQKKN
ncbi:calpastatin isoform X2 [Eublepharis macularius]|uniref:Calpastatin n=1 Tax=Eublepharis macularius TaxID=481883 RepID=A0AA97JQR9_EUBMA|nr:calpastatin isoform X2 [Eublepharis macularius]